jgi:hypothetical protein
LRLVEAKQTGLAAAGHLLIAVWQGAVMMWIIAMAMLGVGNYWIRVRRERKARANPYVPE